MVSLGGNSGTRKQEGCKRGFYRIKRISPDLSKVILELNDKGHVALIYSHIISCGRGISCVCPVVTLAEEIQSVYARYSSEDINEQDFKPETTVRTSRTARADILEFRKQHPKQTATTHMQINLCTICGLAVCQQIHIIQWSGCNPKFKD